ncbi:BTAD domain-containing putative transcriptional regulator [Roseococcus sp. YIM B11640]|uniref:BTAD domain-containing putative transcriptional regulator n=1 Tax=Roseococcus sp. YIM B11640 TaxID=3133973 RepID=UPI003C7CDD48
MSSLEGRAGTDTSSAGAARPAVEFGLFGGVSLFVAGTPVVIANRKARALLAYLALSGSRAERRERLCGLFWAEVGEHNARTSLRQALFDIRAALRPFGLDDLMVAGREEVGLTRGMYLVDTERALGAVALGELPGVLQAQPRVAERMLHGFEDMGAEFNEWVAAQRLHLQDGLLAALEGVHADPSRPHAQRRAFAEAAHRLDPLNESACRAVMQLAAEAGETGAALRAYGALYEALENDLDMEPAEATQALVARIKQGLIAPLSVEPAPPPRPASLVAQPIATNEPVVAILPVRRVGSADFPEYFADGLVLEIVSLLSGLREPVVISSASSFALKEPLTDLAAIGQRLGARYLLSSVLRSMGSHAKLSVELAEAATGHIVWAQTYDVRDAPLFETQDSIAQSIARTLAPRVQEAELRRSRRAPPGDLGAYHLMLQARELISRLERAAFEQAGGLLQRAMELDQGYSASRAVQAAWHGLRLGQGWSPNPAEDAVELEKMARLAIALDGGNAPALSLLGHNRAILHRDYDVAVGLFDRALTASPNDAEGWMWSSPTFAYMGEIAEGLSRAERAIKLSPHDPFLFRHEHFLSIAHYAAGNFEEAAHWGQRSHARNPLYTSNLRMTAAALAASGRIEEARRFANAVLALQPEYRVMPVLARQAFRDAMKREQYGQHLIAAGLPA